MPGDGRCREDFAEDGKDFGNAKRLLEAARFARAVGRRLDKIAGHVNDHGLVNAGGVEDLLRGFVAGERMAVGDKIDVAKQDVVAAFADKLNGADGRGGGVDMEAVGGEAFLEQHADALFVVEDKDGAAGEDACVDGTNRRGERGCGAVDGVGRRCSRWTRRRRGRIFVDREREKDSERGAADRQCLNVDGTAVLANDRGTNADPGSRNSYRDCRTA